ncbi:MAG: hypothetical protein WCR85_00205 [Sphaerochaeta sp.]
MMVSEVMIAGRVYEIGGGTEGDVRKTVPYAIVSCNGVTSTAGIDGGYVLRIPQDKMISGPHEASCIAENRAKEIVKINYNKEGILHQDFYLWPMVQYS